MNSKVSGGDEEVTIAFDQVGIKRLLVEFANLHRDADHGAAPPS